MKRIMSRIEIQEAYKKGHIIPYFQTLHRTRDGACSGVEILTRINDPINGIITPASFLPFLERHEMALPITEKIMGNVLDVLHDLDHLLPVNFNVSFNVGANLLNNQGLVKLCCSLAERLNPSVNICVELTERQEFFYNKEEQGNIKKLKDASVKVILDDFGIAHSDLRLLSRYESDGIKIPRELISNDRTNKRAEIIEKYIIAIARDLGMEVTAEGITTLEQYNRMKSCEVDYMQGYFFSKPISGAEFKQLWM